MNIDDPRAAGFDEAQFRDGILFAMNLGLPEDESKRITFRWTKQKQYDIADPGGNPYNWASPPSKVVSHPDVLVPAAVKFSPRLSTGGDDGPFGQIDNPIIEVTLLDTDYSKVENADTIILDGSVYMIDFVKPPDGLFGVTIYTIYAHARDEA